MPKIDTSSWGEFRIGDYFKVEYGKFRPKEELGKGDFNYVTTSGFNNGITDKIDKADHIGNCITVASDGEMGVSFYQEKPFATSNIVSTLTPFETTPLNKYIAQFICSIIYQCRHVFSWEGYKMSVGRVRNLVVKLPIDSNGNPDWQYMEDYMRNIEVRVSDSISKLESAQGVENSKIDVSSWGDFRIGDLFTQERGKESSPNRVEDGTLPMVNEINTNNGIAKFGKSSNVILGNCITVSVNYATNVFYQKNDFCASVNILVIRNTNMNEYSGKFIAGILSRNNLKYDYTNKISKDRLNDEFIKLPVDSKGNPDWQYMEEYMKNIESKVKRKIDMLIQI